MEFVSACVMILGKTNDIIRKSFQKSVLNNPQITSFGAGKSRLFRPGS